MTNLCLQAWVDPSLGGLADAEALPSVDRSSHSTPIRLSLMEENLQLAEEILERVSHFNVSRHCRFWTAPDISCWQFTQNLTCANGSLSSRDRANRANVHGDRTAFKIPFLVVVMKTRMDLLQVSTAVALISTTKTKAEAPPFLVHMYCGKRSDGHVRSYPRHL